MRFLFLGLALTTLSGLNLVAAHDIGVSQAELAEKESHRYVLSVRAGPAVAYLFAAPLLPEHCRFAGSPRGSQGAGWRSFEFTCEEGLTAADSIDLPWRRDGIMLTAKWLDGSEAKRLFRNEAGRINIPLAQLQAASGS